MSTTKATVAGMAPTGAKTRPSRRRRTLAVLGAAAATLTVWAVAGPLAGVDLRVHVGSGMQQIDPATVVAVSILTGLAGWALLAAVEHFTPRPRAIWTATALAVLALSLAGPLSNGATTAAKVALTGMHLAAAAVLIPVLTHSRVRARTTAPSAERSPGWRSSSHSA
jgi:Family of unknown function (DUF6069)